MEESGTGLAPIGAIQSVRRAAARYRVFLSVRYEVAADFVREFAENLSHGGMFIRGARGLVRRRDVVVELDLPGYGVFEVMAEVAHVVSDQVAAEQGCTAGAGLAIRESPDGFDQALSGYLTRLARRADAIVLAEGETARTLQAAGYQVRPIESPERLGAQVDACERPPVGVVVPDERMAEFAEAARGTHAAELLVAVQPERRIDDVLAMLDRRL